MITGSCVHSTAAGGNALWHLFRVPNRRFLEIEMLNVEHPKLS